jgi:hypothetical protein
LVAKSKEPKEVPQLSIEEMEMKWTWHDVKQSFLKVVLPIMLLAAYGKFSNYWVRAHPEENLMKQYIASKVIVTYDGVEQELNVDGYAEYTIDVYGEDADGNRGRKEVCVTDITGVGVYTDDALEVYAKLSKADQEKVQERLTSVFLEDY